MLAELTPDVPLYVGDGFAADEWQLATGVTRPAPDQAQEYATSAWLPGPMRAPTDVERARYATVRPPDDRGFAAVFPIDRDAAAALRDYFAAAQRGVADEAAGVAALKRLLIGLARHLVIDGTIETRQPTIDPPRQLTVTRDFVQRRPRRVGLHHDRWTTEAGAALDAPNRIALNLGPGTRWLLYVPHSVAQLRTASGLPADEHGREVLGAFADQVPVLRVAVPPNHAYVAPTEAVFHDGSTLGSDRPALKQHLLGRFRIRR